MNLFFDLDGTLINSLPRLYKLFQFLVPESTLSYDEYWNLKRNKISHKDILTGRFYYSIQKFQDFELKWMTEIEKQKWLDLDQPFEGTTNFLNQLKKKHKIILVTARQSKENVLKQIQNFGWENIFSDILVTEQKQEKYQLIQNTVHVSPSDLIIGDTGKDIQTGKLLGIKTVAVLTGFLNKENLITYNPDEIINTVLDLNIE
jgi:phosphoglycolate phosphatase